MEHIINLHVEKLPEGIYLATCDDIQGLVAQGRTIAETIEIARDIVGILIEAQRQDSVQMIVCFLQPCYSELMTEQIDVILERVRRWARRNGSERRRRCSRSSKSRTKARSS